MLWNLVRPGKHVNLSRIHRKLLRSVWISFLHNGGHNSSRCYSDYIPKKFSNRFNVIMPRDKEQVLALRKHRERLKKKSEGYTPSRITLQVLGSGARGAPRSLYVSTDHAKYLFNCGEGTQRLSHEHHLRLSRMENIFVTTPTWSNMGGLPGVVLTLQECGVPSIKIHGPKGTVDLFKGVQRFVTLKDVTVSEAACKKDEPYVDQGMSVRYVMLYKPGSEILTEDEDDSIPIDNVDYYAYVVNQNGKRSSLQDNDNGRKFPRTEDLLKGGRVAGSMAFICKLSMKPGTLSLEKCVDKGVKPGPMLGKLKSGLNVTLEDGTVVLSSEVRSPNDAGPIFIVLECPDEEYLDSFLNCEAFKEHQASASQEDDVAKCVVHFTPERVLKNPRYREWMEKFAPTTRHILINEENICSGSEAVHRMQHQLHLLHPTIFPFVSEEGFTVDNTSRYLDLINNTQNRTINNERKDEGFPLITRAKTLDAIHLRPFQGLDTSKQLVLTPRAYMDEVFAVDGFLDSLAELQTEINACTRSLGETAEYPKIVMLGTGSSVPNKIRNTSGILLRIDEENSIILDCGEGTAGQLIRFYGRTEVDKVLATIKVIYVSHLHADHHIGLIGLLNERGRVTKVPVRLLAPEQIGSWLRIYNRRFENILDKVELFPNKDFDMVNRILSVTQETKIGQVLKDVQFSTVRVKHCFHSFGVLITLKNGCKIVYSGDTMPCDALVELGKNCDLLIHEATMEDDLEKEARMKMHSTISQAIDIGERMKAKFILLTHFSQRYSKLPHFSNNENAPNLSKVGIAYDLMQISISQLPLLSLMYPALNIMFSDFRIVLEERALKRQVRLKKEIQERNEEMTEKLP